MHLNKQLKEKNRESLASVLPITAIVFLLSITIAPLEPGALVLFLFGAILLIFGMGLFTLGVDMSMMPMGEGVGVEVRRSKHLLIPIVVYFLLGVLSTMAEPDLQVLAEQVPAIDNQVLILTVAAGVGLFLVVAALRIRKGVPLRRAVYRLPGRHPPLPAQPAAADGRGPVVYLPGAGSVSVWGQCGLHARRLLSGVHCGLQ